MKREWQSPNKSIFVLILAFVQLHCLLIPDEDRADNSTSNQVPIVRITSSAMVDAGGEDGDGGAPGVRFEWSGLDDDGTVVAYEWALNDPLSKSSWHRTTGTSTLVRFAADVDEATGLQTASLTRWNTFFVRAIDDESAVSEWERKSFNVTTVVPTSVITFPIVTGPIIQLNSTQLFEWEEEDPGDPVSGSKVMAWEYKLVRIREVFDSDEVIRDSLLIGDNLLSASMDGTMSPAWERVPFEESSLRVVELPRNASLAFAVRAVDETGSVEPFLERGRNMLPFVVRNQPGQPIVTMIEPTLGQHRFPSSGEVWEVSVPTNRELSFQWRGDASHYGSLPGNSTYALDIPDPNGMKGWADWKPREGTDSPISFGLDEGGTTHDLWVRMRDISDSEESEQLCHVRIAVVPFTFERFVLVVDDAKFSTRPPTDAMHDAFLRDTITRRFYDLGEVDHLALYPPRGTADERANPIDVALETLAQYQHIFWSVQIGAGNPQPLRMLEAEDGKLSAYSSAGGRLFFGGGRISSFMLGGPNGNFSYPKDPPLPGDPDPDYEQDSFIWNFMKYRDTIVSVPTRDTTPPQREASGLIALRSQQPAYPDLFLDREKRDPFEVVAGDRFLGGIKDWEGVQERLLRNELPGLAPLYSPVTLDTTLCCGYRSAGFDDAVVAHRYESTAADTVDGTQQGRTVIFNFQPYWLEEDGLTDAGTAAINWLVNGRDH